MPSFAPRKLFENSSLFWRIVFPWQGEMGAEGRKLKNYSPQKANSFFAKKDNKIIYV
jgi:hypothetical protein